MIESESSKYNLNSILAGFVPDAFDPTPGVPVQCPEPGGPLSQQKGAFGTCTMHPTHIDYVRLLSEVRPDLFAGLKNLDLPHPKKIDEAVPANLRCGQPGNGAAAISYGRPSALSSSGCHAAQVAPASVEARTPASSWFRGAGGAAT